MTAHNVGDVTGDVVVIVYLSGPSAGKDGAALRTVIEFFRASAVRPGATVEFPPVPLRASHLAVVSEDGKLMASPEGAWKGSSSDETVLPITALEVTA